MLKTLLIVLTVLSFKEATGQIYSGISNDGNYNCQLEINRDSTIKLIYDRDQNGIYAQNWGRIRRKNDTSFVIEGFMRLGQFYMKTPHPDTLYIQVEGEKFLRIEKVTVIYSNGTVNKLKAPKGLGRQYDYKLRINDRLFNSSPGNDFVTISIPVPKNVSKDDLHFRIPYGSAASFTAGHRFQIEIVIIGQEVKTIGNVTEQVGHFRVKKKNSK